MSGRWVQECKRILEQIKKLEGIGGRDRLDMVRTIKIIHWKSIFSRIIAFLQCFTAYMAVKASIYKRTNLH